MGGLIRIEFMPGDSIEVASETAVRVSNILGVATEFKFNDVTCYTDIGGDARWLAENYMSEMGRKLRTPYDRRFAHGNWQPSIPQNGI